MIGLEPGHNTLSEPDPAWAEAFEAERQRLRPVLPDSVLWIEHHGSTSVPGLKAKPIIDVLVGIAALEQWTGCIEPLRGLGYAYFEDAGVPQHHVFSRMDDRRARTNLLHIVEFRSAQWTRNLGFRDRLRADPALRQQYETVKLRAASQAPCDRLVYNALKSRFIRDVMADIR